MRLVTKWDDIRHNLHQLERYRHSQGPREVKFYKDLMLRGICFVVCGSGGQLLFGPSRFVGYANNDLDTHQANESKHGGKTNSAISKILGEAPTENELLEKEYRDLCARIGLMPKPTGSCGHRRKYWLVKR